MSSNKSGVVVPRAETFKNAVSLAERIQETYLASGLMLPLLTFLSRGGTEIMGTVSHSLSVEADGILHAGVRRFVRETDSNPTQHFEVGQFPSAIQVIDKHLLVIDVVCRRGDKLKYVTEGLKSLGAASVASAVIYDMTPKGEGESPGQYRPDIAQSDGRNLGHAIFHWEYDRMIAASELARDQ